jgi:hypothetical protein
MFARARPVPCRMCHAGDASEVSSLRGCGLALYRLRRSAVSGLGPALTEIRPNRIWAVLRRSERCEAQWLRRMLGLDRQAARQSRAAESNGLRIRRCDEQVAVSYRGTDSWSHSSVHSLCSSPPIARVDLVRIRRTGLVIEGEQAPHVFYERKRPPETAEFWELLPVKSCRGHQSTPWLRDSRCAVCERSHFRLPSLKVSPRSRLLLGAIFAGFTTGTQKAVVTGPVVVISRDLASRINGHGERVR